MKKTFKIIIITLLCLALIYTGAALSGRLIYADFYRIAGFEHKYQGTNRGFVPQGITLPDGEETVIVCGYMNKEGPSRLYLCTGGKTMRADLKQEDGSDYTGHAGGLTAAGNYVYISNAHKLFVLELSEVLSAKNGDTLAFKGHIDVPVNASYCSSDGEYLYVGEYHAPGYDTDESHTAQSADGEYRAYTVAYKLNKTAPLGIEGEPVMTFAHTDCVQGFASLGEGRYAVSCSRGFESSRLRIYEVGEITENASPVILDSTNLLREIKMPRMSEDLEYREGRLFVGFESCAKKFGLGLLPLSINKTACLDTDRLL